MTLPVSFAQHPPCQTSAPTPDPGRFRLPSPSWAVLTYASALSVRIEGCCPTPVFQVRPFAILRRLLWPRLTSGSPSQHLAMSVALKQTARSPRVLRTHIPAYACRIYAAVFHARMGFTDIGLLTPLRRLYPLPVRQASAFGFLPIPSRDGHRCRSANTSPCRVCRGLPPPSECALPGAPIKRERLGAPLDHRPPPQYFGTFGSTRSDQAVIPPARLCTFLNPDCCRKAAAFALRPPILQ